MKPAMKIKPPSGARPRVVPPKPAAARDQADNPIVAAVPAAPASVKTLAEHTVKDDDTLSGIALKYYGSAKKEYWMYIYNANKDVIGDRPNVLRPGIVIRIPEKPNL
jgi:nucleoid-associated protein YgaU